MSHPNKIIKQIQILRKRGRSINEIVSALGIAKSTVQRHTAKIKLSERALARIGERLRTSTILSQNEWQSAKQNAIKTVGYISSKEAKIVAVCLYWAEGNKSDFSLINSDPHLIRTFVNVIRKEFNVSNDQIVISLRVYEDLSVQKCKSFWSCVTGVRLADQTSVEVLKGRKSGKLEHGMCRVRVRRGGRLLKLIRSLAEQIARTVE